MNENPPPAGFSQDLRALRRSRDDRMVAGVLGGLAHRFGVDPVVLRIVTAVLALFGGVGIVLYAIGWLLIPDEDADQSVAEAALGRGPGGSADATTICLAAGLVLAILIASGGVFGSGIGTVLLVLTVAGIVMMLRRRDDDEDDVPAAPPGGVGYPGFPGYVSPDTTTEPSAAAPDADTARDQDNAAEQPGAHIEPEPRPSAQAVAEPYQADSSGTGWPEGPDWWPAAGETYEPLPEPAPEKRRRSHLGLITLCTVAVAIGALAINDATWENTPPSAYVATALAVIGLGLLIGTWFGRSRALIAWGILFTALLAPATIIGDGFNWRGEDVTVTITDLDSWPAEPREHGAGQVTYDMSNVVLDDADAVSLEIDQSAGELVVILPPNADVTLSATSRLGTVDAFDSTSGGFGASQDVIDRGPDGAGGGNIDLDLTLRIGHIEVTR